jgi:hypothetical protein
MPAPGLSAFVSRQVGFHPFLIYDIGVADFNGDGNLDIFTTNCFAPINLVAGDGQGGFQQVRSELGMDLTLGLPGFGAWDTPPVMDKPGLYIYIEDRYFCVASHDAAGLAPLRGSIRTICRENLTEVRGAEVNVARRVEPDGLISRTISFACQEEAFFRFRPEPHLIDPMRLELDESVPLDKVFMGPDRVSPPSRRFDIFFPDPHSMAWADINGDGRPDVFIGRGAMLSDPGLKPRINELKDRLLLGTGPGFQDAIGESGILKNGCPNRKSCWVDANGDGLLDLFYTGARGADSVLYVRKQMTPMQFEDRASVFGVSGIPYGGFCWGDLDRDGAVDLAASGEGELAVFWGGTQSAPRMERTPLLKTGSTPYKVIVFDYNADGLPDLLYVSLFSKPGFMLFANKGGRKFDAVDMAAMGLPTKGLTAAWCDYDNDGLQDFAVVPGDLYRQTSPGRFEATGLLADLFSDVPAGQAVRAWISWFDMDNNGTRDLLATVRVKGTVIDPPSTRPEIVGSPVLLLENTLHENHWLEIDLVGPPGNRPGIGARATVKTGAMLQTQDVGDNEGSENGQGHYRLYYGLGGAGVADSVEVVWQDGKTSLLSNVNADQILSIKY